MSTARGAGRLRSFLAVLKRDLHAQRMFGALGGLVGLLVPLTIFLPSLEGNDPAEVRDIIAWTLAGIILGGSLIGLGATTLTRRRASGSRELRRVSRREGSRSVTV